MFDKKTSSNWMIWIAIVGLLSLYGLEISKYLNNETINILKINTNIDKDTNIIGAYVKLLLWLIGGGYVIYTMIKEKTVDFILFISIVLCSLMLMSCAIDFISIDAYPYLMEGKPIPQNLNLIGLIIEGILSFVVCIIAYFTKDRV